MHVQYVRRHNIYIYCSFVKCTCAEMVTVLLKQKLHELHEVTLFGIVGADKCRYSRLHTSFWTDTVGRWLLQMKRSGLAPLWRGCWQCREEKAPSTCNFQNMVEVVLPEKSWKWLPAPPFAACSSCLTKVSFTRMEEWYGKGAAWLMITCSL